MPHRQLDGRGQMPEGSQTEFKVSYNGKIDITNNPTEGPSSRAAYRIPPARAGLPVWIRSSTKKQ